MLMKKIKFCSCFYVIILLFSVINTYSQEIKLTDKSKLPINITANMEVFKDSTAQIPFEQIASQKFSRNNKKYIIFPYSNNAFWIKLTLKNESSERKKWLLKWDNPLTEELHFYISDTLGRNFEHSSKRLLTNQKVTKYVEEEITFNFELTPKQRKTVFLKLKSQRGLYIVLTLHSLESYATSMLNSVSSQSFNNGLVIFRLFLVLILGLFIIKDSLFRVYSLQIIFRTLSFFGMLNVAGPTFSSDPDIAKKIDFLCYNSFSIGSGILILSVLDLKKLSKWFSWVVYGSISITVLINIIVCVDYQWYWMKAGHYSILFSAAFILLTYIYCAFKKIKIQIYYSIPFILGVMSNFLINLRLLGILEFKPIFAITTYLFMAEVFLFVLFLGQIFKAVERNKINAEQDLSFNINQNKKLKEIDNLKTTFFTNISHELRTPLTLIIAPIQELLVKYPSDNLLPLMNRNAQRLLTLINQLLDISKLEAGQMGVEMSQNNVSNYFNTLVSSFASLAESKKIDFQFTQKQPDVLGYIDQDKTDKIITNLLSNAFKFTSEGDKVSVNSQFTNDLKHTIITIADSGIGISKEKLPKIFDRFYQVDATPNRNYEGTGIGLALVKELVEVLKGEINVTSREGEGTIFTVKLPIDYETWKKDIVTSVVGAQTPEISVSIDRLTSENWLVKTPNSLQDILLIVDDNADIRAYIRSVFESSYQIIEAINGKDGILKAQETTPNLIISDLMMPEMDGFEFCKFIKTNETTSHIPVIMLTAKANIESRIEGLELGADDYLIKPFNAKEIQVRVKNLLNKQENLRQYFAGKTVVAKAEIPKFNPLEDVFLVKVKNIIEKHLAENNFGIEQFCQEINMSSSQLLRKLKALTNQTTVEFVREYRLQRAAEMLNNHTGTVSNVAFAVGFESLSYFTKAFQEKFGVLPSEYIGKKGIEI